MKMFSKLLEKLAKLCLPILDYGWIIVIPLAILYFLFPDIYDSFAVKLIIFIPLGIILLTLMLWIGQEVGGWVFKKYSDEYEELVKKGELRSQAFAKTAFKAIIVFIILLLLALLIILKNLVIEPRVV